MEGRVVQEEEDELDEQAVEELQEGQGVDTIDNSEEDYSRDADGEDDEEEDFGLRNGGSCLPCLRKRC